MDFSDIWLAVRLDIKSELPTTKLNRQFDQLAKCINYTGWQRTSEVAFAWFLINWTYVCLC